MRRWTARAQTAHACEPSPLPIRATTARHALAGEQLHAPHLIDSELANELRRRVAARQLEADAAWTALDSWRRLGMTRYAMFALLDRVWELRENASAHDASYVALAELLDCCLLTVDGRAPGTRCPITVMPVRGTRLGLRSSSDDR